MKKGTTPLAAALSNNEPKLFKIEKGVPMPNGRHRVTDQILELAKKMKVGDSIAVPLTNKSSFAYVARKFELAMEFKSRKIADNEDMVRVWRVR